LKEVAPSSVWEIPDRRFNPDTTGVLFFDFKNFGGKGRVRHSPESLERKKQAVANAIGIREAARKRGLPLFITAPDHRADGLDTPARLQDGTRDGPFADPEMFRVSIPDGLRGQWEAQVMEALAPDPEDTLILKHRWSAFHGTHLELSLRLLGVDTLAILGGALEAGIASTAYAARDHDVSMLFIRDAISAGNQAAERLFMESIFPHMGLVRSTEWFIKKLEKE
jgi:nicotinamidase-related amidase